MKPVNAKTLGEAREASETLLACYATWSRMGTGQLAQNAEKIVACYSSLCPNFQFDSGRFVIGYAGGDLEVDPQTAELLTEWLALLRSLPMWPAFQQLQPRVQDALVAHRVLKANNSETANVRWSRLQPVKEWAFQQRRDNPGPSRAAVIKAIVPEVRAMAKQAGEALSGDDQSVIRTVTSWFREAGIR